MSISEADHQARLRAEIVNAKDIPTIPALLVHILTVVDGERSSARELIEVIQRDQALTSRVLRLANSGFFACQRQVATLPRAVILLGFSTIKNLALGVKIWDMLMVQGGAGLTELWEHSALVAAAARLLAQRTRAAEADEAFTAGLLHDIGRVVLMRRFPAVYGRLTSGGEGGLETRERAAFGVDHAQAGAWLFEAWALPAAIVESAARHHEPLPLDAPLGAPTLVNVANRLVCWTNVAGELAPGAEAELATVAAVGLSLGDCAEIAAVLQGQKDDVRRFYGGDA